VAKTKRVTRNAPGARVAREPKRNPNLVVYHTTTELTMEVVDDFWGSPALRAVPGIGRITANRYRARIWRRSGAVWDAIFEKLDAAMRATLGAARVEPCPADDDHRMFPLPDSAPGHTPRAVYEGVKVAAADPLAASLFAIEGVAEVILDGRSVTVRKGRLFSWEKLEPEIHERLRAQT
jgi:hypothetical protein